MRRLKWTHEQVRAVSTGAVPVAFALIGAAIDRAGYELADWVIWSGAALGVVMLIVSLATIAQLVWGWLRTRRGRSGVDDIPAAYGKYVVGGRAEDRAGVTIGPLPTAEAIALWRAEEREFIPLDDAARWLYDNAEPWLKEVLQRPEPFNSIAEHAAALVGTAADDGVCELRASRERGLAPEPMKFSELKPTAFESVFDKEKRFPVDPIVRRADLLNLLKYYRNPLILEEPIRVRRDKPMREALMFAVTGQWGGDPWTDGGGQLGAISTVLESVRQLAADGAITVWGKANNHDVWQEIDRRYWINHYIDILDVLRSNTRTKAHNTLGNEPLFTDLAVSRAEFEAQWREV
jgi:hypothetical protein